MRRLARILLVTLALIGLLAVALVGLGIWGAVQIADKVEPPLPKRMVLTLDLEGKFHEAGAGDPFAKLSGEKVYVLRKAVEAIDAAGSDPRVVGLLATMGKTSLSLAAAQELRDAVGRFRASGKPAVVFAETMGEFGAGTLDYYLATGFGQLWLQPSGDVGLTGVLAESPFVKGTLDLLGIKPEFSGRWEYKSAIELFTETGFTQPHKQNLGRLLDSWTGQMVDGIASARKLPPDKVRALLGNGPFVAAEALSAGLVDKLGYREAALQAVTGGGAPAKEVDAADYAGALPRSHGTKVAVVVGTGAIHRGDSDHGFGAADDFGSKTIAKAFRDAIDDKEVKAIIFRIDSPGGSYVASDTVWNEVRRAREAGKPVVASMGGVAASGGYFVAMGADRVIAQPGTITGSIGVFSGKMVMADFWKKIGVSWDELHRGDNAAMWSVNQPFSPQAWARVNAVLDRIYADFTTKAAEGRHIPPAKMDELARGRIWSGADAKAAGLVDSLGGWREAVASARELARLPADAPVELVAFPRPSKPWELLAETMSGGSQVRGMVRAVRVLEPVLARLDMLVRPGDATLMMPPLVVDGGRP
ncbi:MAG: signal peptide peptidase SppA [Actinomycetota bacterium]